VSSSRAHNSESRAPAQFPQVNAGASYQYTRPNSENSPFLNGSRGRSPFTGDDFETSVDLAFELDLWGRLRRATEAARAELLAREENRRAVLITLVSDVARTYFGLLELDQELEIARRTLQTREESLQLQRRRFQQGLSTQLDVDRADAEAAVAAATVPDLERRIAQNENALSVLLGRNPGPIARGTHRSTGNGCRRRCQRGCRRRSSSAGPTFARPNRRWSPPTPESVWQRRNTSQRSRSQECWASRACRCPTSSPGVTVLVDRSRHDCSSLYRRADQEHRQGL